MSALFTLYSTMSCKNLAYCWKMAEMLVEVCQRKEHPPRRRSQRTRPEGKAENKSEDIIFATLYLYLTKLPNDQLILDMGKGSVKGEIPNSLHPNGFPLPFPPRFNPLSYYGIYLSIRARHSSSPPITSDFHHVASSLPARVTLFNKSNLP